MYGVGETASEAKEAAAQQVAKSAKGADKGKGKKKPKSPTTKKAVSPALLHRIFACFDLYREVGRKGETKDEICRGRATFRYVPKWRRRHCRQMLV